MDAHDHGNDEGAVRISDVDRARVRELKRMAVQCLIEVNQILAPYMGRNPDEITSVRVNLDKLGAVLENGVPPVFSDPCIEYDDQYGCAYLECDPPGVTQPCHTTSEP